MSEATRAPAAPDAGEPGLLHHADLFALAMVAAGFGIRVFATLGRYLEGDEALQFQMANLHRLADVYAASLGNAHPPLFFFLLRLWSRLGNSEFFLRSLSVILGAGFLWMAYRWVLSAFGKRAALPALALLSFSPALVRLSAEVRGYALLLFFVAAALAAFESAVSLRSPGRIALFSAFLCLAILTHYSALIFAAAMFVYAVARMRSDRPPAGVVRTWALLQAVVVLLCVTLGVTHLARLRGSGLEREVMTRMLRADYFQADQDGRLDFLLRQTLAVFRFLCGSSVVGIVALVFAGVGVAIAFRKRRLSALLLVLPFLLEAFAALADLYPYGGTRHSALLLLFASAAVGIGFSSLVPGRLWPSLVIAAVMALVALRDANAAPSVRRLENMTAAIGAIRASIPAGSLVFTDFQTGNLLQYYLGRNTPGTERAGLENFLESSPGGYRVVESHIWNFNANSFGAEMMRFVEAYRVPAEVPVWAVHSERNYDAARELSRRFPGIALPRVLDFGEISVVEARRAE